MTSGPSDGGAPRGSGVPWWVWIALIDLLVVFLAALPAFAQLFRFEPPSGLLALRRSANLLREMNLAVWWSAAVFFLSGGLFYERGSAAPISERSAWWILAVLSFGLSLDEAASLHERVSADHGWPPVIAIGLVCLAALLFALVRLRRHGPLVGWIVAAYLLLGSVGVQERLESRAWWQVLWPVRLGLEEATELAGSLLLLVAAARPEDGGATGRLRAIVARPERFRGLAAVLRVGLLAHLVVAVWVVPGLASLDQIGHPAVWYPGAVHGLSACGSYWAWRESDPARRRAWGLATAFFLVASIGQVFDLVTLVPGIDAVLPRWTIIGFYASYLWLVLPLVLVGLGGRLFAGRAPFVAGALALPLLGYLATGNWRIEVSTPGWVAFVLAAGLAVERGPGERRRPSTGVASGVGPGGLGLTRSLQDTSRHAG